MSSHKYQSGNGVKSMYSNLSIRARRGLVIGLILTVALIAFELFNFDTTQFALESLLGTVSFFGIKWATILAIAFCAIDFAGLNRLFTPEGSAKEAKEVWYLMGAWLLGATMNAVMTWWAVSVTLLGNNLGNEVLTRDQLLRFVPIFVAVLVWLTRILFIGSLTIAGVQLFGGLRSQTGRGQSRQAKPAMAKQASSQRSVSPSRMKAAPKRTFNPVPKPNVTQNLSTEPIATGQTIAVPQSRTSRVRQRPPVPNGGSRPAPARMQSQMKN